MNSVGGDVVCVVGRGLRPGHGLTESYSGPEVLPIIARRIQEKRASRYCKNAWPVVHLDSSRLLARA